MLWSGYLFTATENYDILTISYMHDVLWTCLFPLPFLTPLPRLLLTNSTFMCIHACVCACACLCVRLCVPVWVHMCLCVYVDSLTSVCSWLSGRIVFRREHFTILSHTHWLTWSFWPLECNILWALRGQCRCPLSPVTHSQNCHQFRVFVTTVAYSKDKLLFSGVQLESKCRNASKWKTVWLSIYSA